MPVRYYINLDSPIGNLQISSSKKFITAVEFMDKENEDSKDAPEILLQCKTELHQYFAGNRKTFSVNIKPEGSVFQKQVWQEVSKIPYGKTASYHDVSLRILSPEAMRAVGNANGKNRIAILIPCHRVLSEDGKLTGYAWKLWRKAWLLEHEGKIAGTRLSLFD